jgi:hypothetical protein
LDICQSVFFFFKRPNFDISKIKNTLIKIYFPNEMMKIKKKKIRRKNNKIHSDFCANNEDQKSLNKV